MTGSQGNGRQPGERELQALRAAARELAQEGGRAPWGAGPVFQSVASVLLVGSALVSGTVGLVHLWKELSRPSRPERRRGHEEQELPSHRERVRRDESHHGHGRG